MASIVRVWLDIVIVYKITGIAGRATRKASEKFTRIVIARLGADPEVISVDRNFGAEALRTAHSDSLSGA